MDNKPGTTAFYAFYCNVAILAGDDFLRHSQAGLAMSIIPVCYLAAAVAILKPDEYV